MNEALVAEIRRCARKGCGIAWNHFMGGGGGRVKEARSLLAPTLGSEVASMARAQIPWEGWDIWGASLIRVDSDHEAQPWRPKRGVGGCFWGSHISVVEHLLFHRSC